MKEDRILLAHGSGGRLMQELIREIFTRRFNNPVLNQMDDSASLNASRERIAFTTDTYVVQPIFFAGGDIGKLAVCGTVNDLATTGASPKYISVAFIIEEGLSIKDLEKIIDSMVLSAKEAEVVIVTGDTKVVEKGGADKLFINTTGVGFIPKKTNISGSNAKPGDKIILSGTIGDHGIAIMSQREGLEFKTKIKSDCAPLNGLVATMLKASSKIHALRDPTRGGLASTLNEIAEQSQVEILVEEDKVPIKEEVLGACEMLGYDPFHVANEGKMVAIVESSEALKVLQAMRGHHYGKEAQVIGEVTSRAPGKVVVKTSMGAHRILDMLVGEQLPRIC